MVQTIAVVHAYMGEVRDGSVEWLLRSSLALLRDHLDRSSARSVAPSAGVLTLAFVSRPVGPVTSSSWRGRAWACPDRGSSERDPVHRWICRWTTWCVGACAGGSAGEAVGQHVRGSGGLSARPAVRPSVSTFGDLCVWWCVGSYAGRSAGEPVDLHVRRSVRVVVRPGLLP